MLKYKNFKLIKPDNIQSKRMHDIIVEHNGSIFHEVELNKIVQKNYGTELYYLVDNPENINCLTPVHISKNKFGTKRYNCNPLGDLPYAGFVGIGKIDLKELKVGISESLKYAGFPYANDNIHRSNNENYGETNMVDLSLGEDEIFSRMAPAKRRNIRKAEKNGIVINHYFSIEGLELFWPILEQLHKALGYKRFNFDYYKEFLEKYNKNKQAFVLLAYKDNKPISGLFILGNSNYMHYYKGATLFNSKQEGQNELLHWEAIKLTKSLGVKYYDLCNLDKNKLPGLYRFKTGISQNIIKYPKHTLNNLGYRILSKF